MDSKIKYVHTGKAGGRRYSATGGRSSAGHATSGAAHPPRATKSSHTAQGSRGTRTAARQPHPARGNAYVPHRPRRRRSLKPVLAVLVVIALAAGVGCWYFKFRNITVAVNGQSVTTRVNSTIETLLADNDNFGVAPGRLLSVGGNVLDEQGGDACAVKRGDEAVAAKDFATTTVSEGDTLTVENGADATEPAHDEEVELPCTIQSEGHGAVQYVSQWGKPGKKIVTVGETSGETIDKEIVEEATNMVVTSKNLSPKGGKYVAITFDDGPSDYTQQILDILEEKGAKATFYNLGENAQNKPKLTKAVIDGGHELASHTMAHQNLPKLDRDSLRNEITTAFDALKEASGESTQMIRAPYGAFTATEWARSGDIVSCNVLWNIDTLDWKRPGADAITAAALDGVKNGSIILMHDGGGNREQDVEALPAIIDELHNQGYELVTVSKLMELDGSIPDEVIENKVKLPKDSVLPEA